MTSAYTYEWHARPLTGSQNQRTTPCVEECSCKIGWGAYWSLQQTDIILIWCIEAAHKLFQPWDNLDLHILQAMEGMYRRQQ